MRRLKLREDQSFSRNPALPFLRSARSTSAEQLIRDYALYLLKAADAYQLPVKLEKVQRHFQLKPPVVASLDHQRGFISENLQIYLNADDRGTVRKFSHAHEFIEALFLALACDEAEQWVADDVYVALQDRKEYWCERGAAEIVMPRDLFRHLIPQPVRLAWAMELATLCELSLTATLWRIIETGPADAVLVIWRFGHAPRESVPSASGQLNLFGEAEAMDPPKKPRVVRAISPNGSTGLIPKDKSAPGKSSIAAAFHENGIVCGYDDLDLVGLSGRYFCESFSFRAGGEQHVMTLVHLRDPLVELL